MTTNPVLSRALGFFILGAALMVSACTDLKKGETLAEAPALQHLQALQAEADPAPYGSLPQTRAEGFERVARKTPLSIPVIRQQPPTCYASIVTRIRNQLGNTCRIGAANQAKAEIAGWSERCVIGCNSAARLAEINAAAAGKCNAFCAQFSCGAQYAPRRQCGTTGCYAGSSSCNATWPMMDYCMLLQASRVWNCECVPPVTP